jgi:hypothetical protein
MRGASVLALCLLAGTARAQEAGERYGWQIAIPDAVADALMLTPLIAKEPRLLPLVPVGLGIHVFDGVIVHLAHGRHGAAAASMALRTLVPFTTALVCIGGLGLKHTKACTYIMIASGIAMQAVDWFVLAREEGLPAPVGWSFSASF